MDISAEIAAIQAASQGSELRQPLVGALNKLNTGSLPAVTVSDVGKILKVGTNGWEVGEKSGYMPVPTDTKRITENGTYDVTNYASASVNVSDGSGSLGDVHVKSYPPSNTDGNNGDVWFQCNAYINVAASNYIDTGISVSDVYGFVAKLTPKQSSGYNGYFGATRDVFTLAAYNVINKAYYRNRGTEISHNITLDINEPNVISLTNGVFSVNGTNVSTNISTPVEDSSTTVCLMSQKTSANYGAIGHYYEFSLQNINGDDLIHLYPEVDTNNNICMFDIVSKQLFYPNSQNQISYELADNRYKVFKKSSGTWLETTNIF